MFGSHHFFDERIPITVVRVLGAVPVLAGKVDTGQLCKAGLGVVRQAEGACPDGCVAPVLVRQNLVDLGYPHVPRRHVQGPRRYGPVRLDLQRVVVDGSEALCLGDVPAPQIVPSLDFAERVTRAAPRDDVLRLRAVLPVRLEVRSRDRSAVLEHRVLAQLHRPDGQVLVGGDGRSDPGPRLTLLVEHERRAEHVCGEQPVAASVAPGRHRIAHPARRRHVPECGGVRGRHPPTARTTT